MKKARFLIAFTILTSCVSFCFNSTASAATADNWPQWRGPFFNGTSLSTNLPATWSKDTNVKWTTPLPGKSGSTPVVWGDNIFLSTPDENDNLLLYCIGRETGETKWTRLVVEGGNIRVGKNNFTSPSPVTDGERVIVMFGTGDLAAFDFNGNELWSRNLCEEYGKFAFMWLYGSSPLLFDNKLYIEVLQRTPPTYSHAKDDKPERDSFLLCLNPET
ncbi:MAG: PQQ-like beta-propeller repeat protein, partial [Verrucomicrobia bacterium]|nr:PQQ-like beta-propeller repeat protein [Verrucomicrobiota bacterium]